MAVLLVLLTFLAYHNSLHAPLLLDDTLNVTNNVSIRQLWPPQSPSPVPLRGRPVVNFSYALNYAWAGATTVLDYHLTNVAIHAAAALTLLGIVRRTLRLPFFSGEFETSADFFALAVAACWAVHPLLTEAVTYLSQRTESLMGLFYLLTLYCFIRGASAPSTPRRWFCLSIVASWLGLGCKEVMVTVPVTVWLYDRTFLAGTFAAAWRRRRGFYLGLATGWLLLAATLHHAIGAGVGVGYKNGVGAWEYALTECRAVVEYLRLALWPTPLVFDYGGGLVRSFGEVWPQALLLSAALIGVMLALKFRPVLGFLLAWPFLVLSPTSSIVPVANQPMAEHRMYLPLVAIVVLGVFGFRRLLGRLAWIPLCGAALSLSVMTYARNAVYGDAVTLWEDTVSKVPGNDRAVQNLGNAYLHAGRIVAAEHAYASAVRINRYNVDAITNLGFIYAQTNRVPKAIDFFNWVIQLAPADAEGHYNLGCALLSDQRFAEAQPEFERVIQLAPRHAGAHNNLAIILARMGQQQAAVEHYSTALLVTPDDAEIYANRAEALAQLDQIPAAVADYQHALALNPNLTTARDQLRALQQPLSASGK